MYNLVSIEVFIGIEIAATVISFLIMLTMHFFDRKPTKTPEHKQSQIDSFKETLGYIKKRKLLRDIIVLAVVLNLLATIFTIGLPFIIVSELDFPNQIVSYLDMAFSVGIVVGSIVVGAVQKRLKFTTKIYIPLFIASLGTIGLGWLLNSRSILILTVGGIILMLIFAMALSLMNISIQVWVQSTTPTKILGRVMSTLTTACTISMPLGIIGYTLLFKFIQQGAMIFVGSGILMLIYTIWCISLFKKDFQSENNIKAK